ncbi:MAG: protein translocase subunit SecF [Candidatus Melainabacteria bacterium]|jgi:preprotein translocase subunit SecF|nr:protein translocase subunit SecF [Candidatus Melainabacteria bacterium]
MTVNSVKNSKVWFGFSALLVGTSLLLMVLSTVKLGAPVRLGLDFTGGTKLEYSFVDPTRLANLNSGSVIEILNSIGLNNSTATITQDASPLLIIRTKAISDDPAMDNLNLKLIETYGEYKINAIDTVSPIIGPELFQSGLLALCFTVIGIIIYISSRFKRDYAFAAILALVHDVVILMGLFAFLGLFQGIEVNSLFITAILTTFGFSVHDTIVVFDRIRENQKLQTQKFKFSDVANLSVNQVSTRSLNTSITTLTVLAFLFFFGGASTQLFVAALFVGLAIGTYSSLFLASPLLVAFRAR